MTFGGCAGTRLPRSFASLPRASLSRGQPRGDSHAQNRSRPHPGRWLLLERLGRHRARGSPASAQRRNSDEPKPSHSPHTDVLDRADQLPLSRAQSAAPICNDWGPPRRDARLQMVAFNAADASGVSMSCELAWPTTVRRPASWTLLSLAGMTMPNWLWNAAKSCVLSAVRMDLHCVRSPGSAVGRLVLAEGRATTRLNRWRPQARRRHEITRWVRCRWRRQK